MFDIKNEDELKKIIKSKDNYLILMEKYYNSKKNVYKNNFKEINNKYILADILNNNDLYLFIFRKISGLHYITQENDDIIFYVLSKAIESILEEKNIILDYKELIENRKEYWNKNFFIEEMPKVFKDTDDIFNKYEKFNLELDEFINNYFYK